MDTLQAITAVARFTDEETESQGLGGTRDTELAGTGAQGLSQVRLVFPRSCGGPAWSGLPVSPPGALPDPGTEPVSLVSPVLAGGFFTTSATWEAHL